MKNQYNIISKAVIFAPRFEQVPVDLLKKCGKWKTSAQEQLYYKILPLTGHPKLGKGLAELGSMWLTGKKEVAEFLKESDRVLKGNPVLVSELYDKGIFGSYLHNKIVKYGKIILDEAFADSVMKEECLKINKAVQKYALDEFSAFAPGGESHVDFIKEETTVRGWSQFTLGLDISVAVSL